MDSKLKQLADYFAKLPGIGPRQAMRLVLAMIEWPKEHVEDFANSLSDLKTQINLCSQCFNLADSSTSSEPGTDLCRVCANPKRDQTKIAVVEKINDLESIEKSGHYHGVYHILGGAISPASGIVPDKLKIRELISRIKSLQTFSTADNLANIEVILATNPNTYGETTAMYLEQELLPLNIRVTRLARGLASGSSLEYADNITLGNALKHRK